MASRHTTQSQPCWCTVTRPRTVAAPTTRQQSTPSLTIQHWVRSRRSQRNCRLHVRTNPSSANRRTRVLRQPHRGVPDLVVCLADDEMHTREYRTNICLSPHRAQERRKLTSSRYCKIGFMLVGFFFALKLSGIVHISDLQAGDPVDVPLQPVQDRGPIAGHRPSPSPDRACVGKKTKKCKKDNRCKMSQRAKSLTETPTTQERSRVHTPEHTHPRTHAHTFSSPAFMHTTSTHTRRPRLPGGRVEVDRDAHQLPPVSAVLTLPPVAVRTHVAPLLRSAHVFSQRAPSATCTAASPRPRCGPSSRIITSSFALLRRGLCMSARVHG